MYFLQNTEISPYVMLLKFCGNAQFPQSFGPKKFPHQEIRWNYDILRGAIYVNTLHYLGRLEVLSKVFY